MFVQQIWYLVEQQALQIDFAKPLLESSGTVGDDMYNLSNERLIRGNLPVPTLYKVPQNDRYESIKLEIDVISARQGREELLDRRLAILIVPLLGT